METLLRNLIEYVGPDYSPEMDSFLLNLIKDAADEVCSEMYPYGFTSDKEYEDVKAIAVKRYGRMIRKIAEYHFDKQGREGTTSWSESGTSVSYEGAGTPSSYLKNIIPVAKIL